MSCKAAVSSPVSVAKMWRLWKLTDWGQHFKSRMFTLARNELNNKLCFSYYIWLWPWQTGRGRPCRSSGSALWLLSVVNSVSAWASLGQKGSECVADGFSFTAPRLVLWSLLIPARIRRARWAQQAVSEWHLVVTFCNCNHIPACEIPHQRNSPRLFVI